MNWTRRCLSWVAFGWLVCQIVAMGAAPIALCLEARTSAAVVCTCSHGDGPCPMHHSKDTRSKPKSDCACRGTTPTPAALLVSLTGISAVMPGVNQHAVPVSSSALRPISVPRPQAVFVVPDGPPPRS